MTLSPPLRSFVHSPMADNARCRLGKPHAQYLRPMHTTGSLKAPTTAAGRCRGRIGKPESIESIFLNERIYFLQVMFECVFHSRLLRCGVLNSCNRNSLRQIPLATQRVGQLFQITIIIWQWCPWWEAAAALLPTNLTRRTELNFRAHSVNDGVFKVWIDANKIGDM